MAYKIGLRLKKSFMFNPLIFKSSMVFDSTLLHILLMYFPAKIVNHPLYFLLVLLTMPIFIGFTSFLVFKLKVKKALAYVDQTSSSDNERLNSFL